jgi:2'-5' RNA ligase
MNEPPTGTVILNICVIPPAEPSQQAVGISQSFESPDTLFVLDGKTKFAHMTTFMARFPEGAIDEVVAAAAAVLTGTKSFRCTHTGYFMTAGRYLEASYRITDEFRDLHNQLIAALAPLRANPGEPFEEGYFTPYTAEQRQNAQETGYDLARNLFRPHVTLTRYREGGVPEQFPAVAAANLSFDLSTVAVFKADDNGAVYEKLKAFDIQ